MRVSGMTVSAQLLAAPNQSSDSVEQLRQILMGEKGLDIAYEEAKEIGDALVEFFELLAETD
jgi:hypothetical protein